MPQPAALRRADAWVERLLHAGPRAAPATLPPPLTAPASSTAAPAAPALITDPSPIPLDPHHQEGLRMVAAHRGIWVQPELERAARGTARAGGGRFDERARDVSPAPRGSGGRVAAR